MRNVLEVSPESLGLLCQHSALSSSLSANFEEGKHHAENDLFRVFGSSVKDVASTTSFHTLSQRRAAGSAFLLVHDLSPDAINTELTDKGQALPNPSSAVTFPASWSVATSHSTSAAAAVHGLHPSLFDPSSSTPPAVPDTPSKKRKRDPDDDGEQLRSLLERSAATPEAHFLLGTPFSSAGWHDDVPGEGEEFELPMIPFRGPSNKWPSQEYSIFEQQSGGIFDKVDRKGKGKAKEAGPPSPAPAASASPIQTINSLEMDADYLTSKFNKMGLEGQRSDGLVRYEGEGEANSSKVTLEVLDERDGCRVRGMSRKEKTG
ncbi:hypothetical protein L198_02980 [Cryptococcus wingfieldii CBS 7118]|uniref:Uncharacterized protein n=1 Tax=Cryptococcus wingfieldii CBS 7118 TaxID=1295528 RepID=A0A1E3JKL2_9TREE|nr:hypothetical protein L198_02980 [Cryptococcus wingfieldii CBS 7118]ODO00657.1 hypothetical protein L198_02980 [Cryptococcus wingfieldii CBS 7118]